MKLTDADQSIAAFLDNFRWGKGGESASGKDVCRRRVEFVLAWQMLGQRGAYVQFIAHFNGFLVAHLDNNHSSCV